MSLEVKPETEQLVRDEIRSGRFASVDDLITQGVLAWRVQHWQPPVAGKLTPAEAITRIRELRRGVTLGGLRVKDLANEGCP